MGVGNIYANEALFKAGTAMALEKGLLLVDTKYEFGKLNGEIMLIDEIHTLIGAGSASGSLDAANILKPALSRGEIQCIGATTIDEYRGSFEKDGAE